MARNTHLPLYDDFLDLFINHEVNNWQAKDFWEKMLHLDQTCQKLLKDVCTQA